MKWLLLVIAGLGLFSGCQSFRYHDPTKAHRGATQFYNRYDNSPFASFWKWQWERLTNPRPSEPPFNPEIVKTDVDYLRANRSDDTLTWIGHSTSLLQIEGVNVLMDPVFSERVSPVSFLGPKRQVPLPFSLQELPSLDVVVVSHAHYDHLDLPTLKALAKRDPQTLFLVPLGDQGLLKSQGIMNVQEFDWWENVVVRGLTFTFTPAQHWTARGLFDRNQTLWGGWHVKGAKLRVLYTGDTGYSKDFSDIQERLGSVDLALIPIGAYEPRWFMGKHHVSPEEAVMIHRDLKASLSVGVHWGTFHIADEPLARPVQDLDEALKKQDSLPGPFRVLKHGETIRIESKNGTRI